MRGISQTRCDSKLIVLVEIPGPAVGSPWRDGDACDMVLLQLRNEVVRCRVQ